MDSQYKAHDRMPLNMKSDCQYIDKYIIFALLDNIYEFFWSLSRTKEVFKWTFKIMQIITKCIRILNHLFIKWTEWNLYWKKCMYRTSRYYQIKKEKEWKYEKEKQYLQKIYYVHMPLNSSFPMYISIKKD